MVETEEKANISQRKLTIDMSAEAGDERCEEERRGEMQVRFAREMGGSMYPIFPTQIMRHALSCVSNLVASPLLTRSPDALA